MEEEFRAILLAHPAIADLVGDRVDWGLHPQGAPYPAIILNVVSGSDGQTMNGSNGLFQGRIQVDCDGFSYQSAKAVARAVRALLHCYRGGGFRLVTWVSTRDGREGGSNEVERLSRVSMDFTVAWRAE